MQRKLFVDLILAALREITGRHPDYFSCCDVLMPPIEASAEEFRALPPFEQFSTNELVTALLRGMQVLDDARVRVRLDCAQPDAISTVLVKSIFDAYAAATGAISLRPPPRDATRLGALLDSSYILARTDTGARYALSKAEERPLLIVSAIGAPLGVWFKLLCDRSVGRRCLVVQSRGSPLFEGGTPHKSTLFDDAADIENVLVANGLSEVDVLAWCSGSRAAIELARSAPQRVASVTLVSPTFYGAMDTQEYPSPFEDNLYAAYEQVKKYPDMAPALLDSLTEARLANLVNLQSDPEKRAQDVLLSPPYSDTRSLLAPLSTLEQLTNYIERLTSDGSYDLRAALAQVRCPINLINGTHDAVTNTQAVTDLLIECGRNSLRATVSGGGHHICSLQYGYLRYALDSLLSGSAPAGTARLNLSYLMTTTPACA